MNRHDKLGDNVDTDVALASRWKKATEEAGIFGHSPQNGNVALAHFLNIHEYNQI